MTKTLLLGATFAAIFALTLMLSPAIAAGFLDFESKTKSDDNELKASINANAAIPKDGTGGAFGYGIITLSEGNPDV